jgi:hypothetical protein
LTFEWLGVRQLLAGDGTNSSLELDPNDVPVDVVQTAPVPTAALDSPLWGNPGNTEPSVLQGDGYGYGELPPQIINFSGTQGSGGWWTFTGQVVDDASVAGLTVTFGGLLAGHTTTARADGTFDHVANLPSGTTGVVTATVTDRNGNTSEPVSFYVG